MADLDRVECPKCEKINPRNRDRCMYCEASLSMARIASSDAPAYLMKKHGRFPWGTVFGILVAGGIGYALWKGHITIPFLEKTTLKEAFIHERTGSDAFTVSKPGIIVARMEWYGGNGVITLNKTGSLEQVGTALGNSPLEIRVHLEPGDYRFSVSASDPPITVTIKRQ